MIDKTLHKFQEGTTYRLFSNCLLDLSGLTFKVISDQALINFYPSVDKIYWIRFTRSSTNKIKSQFNEQGVRILGIRDIAEIEFDIHNDTDNDKELYTIINNKVVSTIGVQKNDQSNSNQGHPGDAANA